MSEEPDSPLGRYALTDDGSGTLVTVVLLGTPLELLVSSREHHDGLMREFRLMALGGRAGDRAAPARLVELTEILGQHYGAAGSRRDQDVDQALAQGVQVQDLAYEVPISVAGTVVALARLMEEADAYCVSAQLMTVQRPPLMKRFAAWYVDQFVAQCAGGPATPWDSPATTGPSTTTSPSAATGPSTATAASAATG